MDSRLPSRKAWIETRNLLILPLDNSVAFPRGRRGLKQPMPLPNNYAIGSPSLAEGVD